MTQQHNNIINSPQSPSSDKETDIKKLVINIFRNWYWFVLCITAALVIAFFYNRYTTPYYKVHTSLLIEEGKSSSPLTSGMGKGDVFQGFSNTGGNFNLYNHMAVLKSKPLINKVIDELDFEVSYYVAGDIIKNEMYGGTPFKVEWDFDHFQITDMEFTLQILAHGKFELTAEGEDVVVYDYKTKTIIEKLPELSFTKKINSGIPIISEYFAFTIHITDNYLPTTEFQYSFRFNRIESLVNRYRSTLSVVNKYERSSILGLSLIDENSTKGITFLNKLAEVYQTYNLKKKNENANRTIRFITSQLSSVSDSLMISADLKQDFQTENRIIDISKQTQQLLDQVNELDKERVALETKDKYYKYLKDYIQTNRELENVIAPSAMGIDDPLLNSLISELNNLIIEKSSMTSVKNTDHPKLKRLNAQIESTKSNLLENTTNIISQSELALSDVRYRLRYFENMIKSLPATEREYVNIERKFTLNNEIYTFLLEKLSESQIAKASNTSDSQIVDEAESSGIVKPNTKRVYAIAFSLGIIIPLLFIFLKDLFNTKVSSDEDIREISKFPLLGYAYNSSRAYKGDTFALDKPNSPLIEPYRAIENKLSFFNIDNENQIIAVTSSFVGEGKSYNAVNIASLYAFSKKKTVILDLDLRRSSMANVFKLDPNKGVVYYLLGKNKLEDIVFKTKHPNLDVIPAGPIPPNPAELLSDLRLKQLIEELKKTYDIIIIDTSPVGAVADTLKISELFDTIVFIVRQNFTNKFALKGVLDEIEDHGIKRLGIILNHISMKSKKHGYGYGYGYKKQGKKNKRKILKLEEDEDV